MAYSLSKFSSNIIEFKIAGDRCVFKFLLRSVDGDAFSEWKRLFQIPPALCWTASKSYHIVQFSLDFLGNSHVGTILCFHCSLLHFLYKLLIIIF